MSVIPMLAGGRPVVGHLLEIRADRLAFFRRATAAAEVVQYRRMRRTVTLLSRPAHIQRLLETDTTQVPARTRAFLSSVLGSSLMTLDGAAHQERRAALVPLLAARPDVTDLLERWLAHARQQPSIDLAGAMRELALQIVSRWLVGATLPEAQAAALAQDVSRVLELTAAVAQAPLPMPQTIMHLRRATRQLDATLAPLLTQADAGAGVLAALLATTPDRQQARDDLVTLFLNAWEPLACALTWLLGLLAAHPEVQQRLAGAPAAERHALTHQILHETLRLYPPIHLLTRQVGAAPLALDEAVVLPAHTYCVVSIYALHRNPALFADPDAFVPERWAQGAVAPFTFLPFGAGGRACPGQHLVYDVAQALCQMPLNLHTTQLPPPRPLMTLRPAAPLLVRVGR